MFRFSQDRGRIAARKQRLSRSKLQGKLRFEGLEKRDLMAWGVSLTSGVAEFIGDSNNDSLVISLGSGGNLAHNLPLGGGVESAIDLSTAPGVQSATVASLTGLIVNGQGGTDSVTLGPSGTTGFTFSGITQGRSIQITAETVTASTALAVNGGNFTATGVSFSRGATNSFTLNGTGVLTLDQTGTISSTGPLTAGSVNIGNASQGASSVTLANLTSTAGDITIRSAGAVTAGAVSASRPSSNVGNLSILASGLVTIASGLTDGGNIAIEGSRINTTSTSASLRAVSSSLTAPFGAITLTTPTTSSANSINLASYAAAGTFSATTHTLSSAGIRTYVGNLTVSAVGNVSSSTGWQAANTGTMGITSSAGSVTLPNIVTTGAAVTINAPQIQISTGGITTWTGSVGGAVTLTGGAGAGGSISVATTITAGAISLDANSISIVSGNLTAMKGTVTVNSTAALTLATVKATNASPAKGDISLTSAGTVTYRRIENDGGTVAVTGASITSPAGHGTIASGGASNRGTVTLSSTQGGITINSGLFTGGFVVNSATSLSITGSVDGQNNNISITAPSAITIGGFLRTSGTGTVTLAGGSVDVSSYVQTANQEISATGSSFSALGVRAGTGNVSIDVTGAIALGTTSSNANSFTTSGTTFSLAANALMTVGALDLNQSGAITINGKLSATSFNVQQNVTTTFGATSIWSVNLANPSPAMTTNGPTVFANGSTIDVNAVTADVENNQVFQLVKGPLNSITNNGYQLTVSSVDAQGESIVLLASLTNQTSNQFLDLAAYVYQPMIFSCAGACTLMLDTNSTPFGPNILLKDGNGDVINTGADLVPLGLVTSISISGLADSTDSLTIDYANGDPLFNSIAETPVAIPASYDGLGGTGTDTLFLVDSNGATNGTYSFDTFVVNATNSSSGTINLGVVGTSGVETTGPNSSTVSFAGLEPITTTMPIVSATLNLTSGDDAVTVANSSATQTTVSGATIETVNFTRPSGSITVNGGIGNDTITIGDYNSQGLQTDGANLTINSESISQQAKITTTGGDYTTTGSGTYSSNLAVNSLDTTGGTGTGAVSIGQTGDVSVGGGQAKSFAVTGANAFTLQGALSTTAGDISITSSGSATINDLSASNGGAAIITISSGGQSLNQMGSWSTDGGQISTSGVGFSGSAGTINTSSAPLLMNHTGNVNTGTLTAGSVTITTTGTFTGTGAITTTQGAVEITSTGSATLGQVTAANAGGPAAITVDAGNLTDGFSNISVTSTLSSTGGNISLTGAAISSQTGATINATNGTTVSSSGTLTIDASSTVNLAAAVQGGAVTITAGSTITTQGSGTMIEADYGNVSLTSDGNISLQGDVFTSTSALSTHTLSINAVNGELAPSAHIYTNGGNISLTGGSYRTNSAGKWIRGTTNTADISSTTATSTVGSLTMNFGTTILINGPVGARTGSLTAGTTFTTQAPTTVSTTMGGSATMGFTGGGFTLNAGGNVAIGDLVWANIRGTQSSSSINAGSNTVTLKSGAAITGNIMRTYGGGLSITSGALNVNGFLVLVDSSNRQGQLTLNNSSTAAFAASVRASRYVVSGGGDVTFSGNALLQVVFVASSPTSNAGRFVQTGAGNLTLSGSSRLNLLAYGTTQNAGPFDVLTTEGTYTYSSANAPNLGTFPGQAAPSAAKYTLTNDTANKRFRVTTVV
jgi:fibronectin-binding autotransporter adhesin